MRHYVYMVQCVDDSLYAGYTTNIDRRLREHNGEGTKLGAKYTRARRPVRLVYQKYFMSRAKAQQHEAALKQLTRPEKLTLIKS